MRLIQTYITQLSVNTSSNGLTPTMGTKAILTATFLVVIVLSVHAVLEENKILIKEVDQIEEAQYKSPLCKGQECGYKCALEKLKYEQNADNRTASYRNFCKQNTSSIANECERTTEYVYCLHREVQNEINKIRDDCVDKHTADMQAYRMETLENLIKKQSFACFMYCFQKNTGVMNEDLSFNFEENTMINATVQQFIADCAQESEKEETKCSQAAARYYCLQRKIQRY